MARAGQASGAVGPNPDDDFPSAAACWLAACWLAAEKSTLGRSAPGELPARALKERERAAHATGGRHARPSLSLARLLWARRWPLAPERCLGLRWRDNTARRDVTSKQTAPAARQCFHLRADVCAPPARFVPRARARSSWRRQPQARHELARKQASERASESTSRPASEQAAAAASAASCSQQGQE